MPGDLAAQVAHELGRQARVSRVVGLFVGVEGNLAVCDVAGSRIRIPMVGYQPYPGTPVWVENQNGRLVCAGSSYQFSPYGTVVSAPSGGLVKVQIDDGPELELPYRSGLSLSSGNRVEVNPVTRVVQGVISLVPAPPDTGGGGSSTGTPFRGLRVQAASSGSSNGGAYWTGDVHSNTTTGGAWFYGSRLRAALKGVTSFTRAEVYLPRLYDQFSDPTLRLHTAASKPGSGLPSFGSSLTLTKSSGWVRIPTSWAEYMRDNAAGLGFAQVNGVFAAWRGRGSDAMSGALRFSGVR